MTAKLKPLLRISLLGVLAVLLTGCGEGLGGRRQIRKPAGLPQDLFNNVLLDRLHWPRQILQKVEQLLDEDHGLGHSLVA